MPDARASLIIVLSKPEWTTSIFLTIYTSTTTRRTARHRHKSYRAESCSGGNAPRVQEVQEIRPITSINLNIRFMVNGMGESAIIICEFVDVNKCV